ncbi:MAG TPA: glycoside hydrolase family 3 N-terminal domain-containing protein, partial [Phototrophicaceae bacterium]|nr:glycoside hydrolase family 3 N-terminal domain-containing protein [Phototrophicaceae bacterium]
TMAPIPLAQAATWSPELVEKAAQVAAREAAADGIHWTFAPMMDIARDARWGRVAEGFGEDPVLCSALAAAAVRGFQGDDLTDPEHVLACAKHFVGYGAAEGGRDYNSAEITEYTLRNVYLPSFHAAVKAGVGTLMSAFHELGGIPTSGNRHLLTEILRDEWGFTGFVVSDWDSVLEMVPHGYAADRADAARLGITAGVDMDMVAQVYVENLVALVRSGQVAEEVVTEAARRILRAKVQLGLFDRPYRVDPDLAARVHLRADHLDASREVARKSIVLLKNENNILPLPKTKLTIGVTGPLAQARHDLLGTWTLDGDDSAVVSVFDGISAAGMNVRLLDSTLTDLAVNGARECDVVVAVVGESAQRSGENNCITTLDLPPGQLELLQALHAVGVPLVVVVLSGRPLSIPWLADHAAAIVLAWHPGTMGGAAIADVVFGDENPSAKLPVSFPRTVGQVPLYYNHKATGRPLPRNRHFSRYQDALDTPLYPFGYGLSYTSFEYSRLVVTPAAAPIGGTITVRAAVTNTGSRAGEEIVQLYIRDCTASMVRPVKELKGFQKIHLDPDQTQIVEFTLGPDELGFYGRDNAWTVEPGAFQVWVGANSNDGLEGTFRLE